LSLQRTLAHTHTHIGFLWWLALSTMISLDYMHYWKEELLGFNGCASNGAMVSWLFLWYFA
jgi:hypothetical protein